MPRPATRAPRTDPGRATAARATPARELRVERLGVDRHGLRRVRSTGLQLRWGDRRQRRAAAGLADAKSALQDRQDAYAKNDLVAAAEADQRLQEAIQAATEAEGGN
ncbi:hypothetical protein [Curtobacterium citreum]|uniref:hypothetical protein n=1 Tax=Curtobacterium citreum TaxID=2036 RepID=UPI0032B0FF5D